MTPSISPGRVDGSPIAQPLHPWLTLKDFCCTGASRKDASLGGRLRSLTLSKSQPELRSAASEGVSSSGVVVLGKEARSKSRRFVVSEDGAVHKTSTPHAPGVFACLAPVSLAIVHPRPLSCPAPGSMPACVRRLLDACRNCTKSPDP
jgi:hypothetical protein